MSIIMQKLVLGQQYWCLSNVVYKLFNMVSCETVAHVYLISELRYFPTHVLAYDEDEGSYYFLVLTHNVAIYYKYEFFFSWEDVECLQSHRYTFVKSSFLKKEAYHSWWNNFQLTICRPPESHLIDEQVDGEKGPYGCILQLWSDVLYRYVSAHIAVFRDSRSVTSHRLTKWTGNREGAEEKTADETPVMEIRLLQEQLVEVDNEHLITLESFICENLDAEFEKFLESLEAQQVSSQCNVVWTTGAIAYRCRNCQVTESRYAAISNCTCFVGFVTRAPCPMSSTVPRTLHLPYQPSVSLISYFFSL